MEINTKLIKKFAGNNNFYDIEIVQPITIYELCKKISGLTENIIVKLNSNDNVIGSINKGIIHKLNSVIDSNLEIKNCLFQDCDDIYSVCILNYYE